MRFLSAHLGAFGAFRDRAFDDLDHAVLVVEGGNEAGKSTVFGFLRDLLYGLYPPRPEAYPYVPRDGESLRGHLRYRLADGRVVTVARRMRGVPAGELIEGEQSTELGNRTVPACRHVPREVYAAVHALRTGDLAALEGRAWDEVQDRLLGGLSVDHLRPARVVIRELEAEAHALWHADDRAATEAADLEARRRDLRAAAEEARARDARLRALAHTVDDLEARLTALRDEQTRLRVETRRAERLAPVRTALRHVRQLDDEAGDLAPYDDIPSEPKRLLDQERDTIEWLEAQVEHKRTALMRLRSTVDAFTDEDRTLLSHADAIRGWTKRVEQHQRLVHDMREAEREAKQARERLDAAAHDVLGTAWDDAHAEAVHALPLDDLRTQAQAYEQAAEHLKATQARAEALALDDLARRSLTPWIAAAVVGLVLVGLGLALAVVPVAVGAAVGGALAVVGAAQGVVAYRTNQRLERQAETLALPAAEAKAAATARDVRRATGALPLAEARRARPDTGLVDALARLRAALADRDAAAWQARTCAEEAQSERDDVQRLAAACGLEDVGARPVSDLVAALEPRLAAAERHRDAAREAKGELPVMRPQVETLVRQLKQRRARRADLRRRLARLAPRPAAPAAPAALWDPAGDGDDAPSIPPADVDDGEGEVDDARVDAGIEALKRRRAAARHAEAARDALHADYPDWRARAAEIEAVEAEAGWDYTDARRVAMAERLDALDDELRDAEAEHAEARRDLERLMDEPTPTAIESEIATLDAELADLRRRRDRRLLLAGLIRRADYDLRMKHQPAVIQRASTYLDRLTDGRYPRLTLEEESGGLILYERGQSFTHPVGPPLSQGTLDQIHLALRLAIIDHLDAEHERLPVLLDEVLVHCDAIRRRTAYAILADMAEVRQLVFFTCHPHVAREVEAVFPDVRRLALGDGGAPALDLAAPAAAKPSRGDGAPDDEARTADVPA